MKTANVPAQITTIEDKIAGNLTLQQMALLGGPIFINFAIYAVLPHMLKLNAYKFILMLIITIGSSALAIRIKSKIIFSWAITICRYNIRPGYYVFSKSSTYLRNEAPLEINKSNLQKTPVIKQTTQQETAQLSEEDLFKLSNILADQSANLSFATSRKDGLYVSISEVR